MRPIDKEVFVCLDCETTGLDPRENRIIEIGLALFDASQTYKEFSSLIDPECIIPESSIAFHHITQDMVQGKPKIQEVLPEVLRLIDQHIIVGHSISTDIEFIARATEKAHIPCTIRNNRFLDTLRMARLYGESPINSLERLRQHFNIEEEGAHRAMADVLVNMDVFRQLSKRYHTTSQLFETLSKPILMKVMPLGPHKGRYFKEIPLQYLLWAANKDFDQDLLYSIRSEIKRRKQGNHFDQASNPFATL